MDQTPKIEQVVDVYLPTSVAIADIPMLAEVRLDQNASLRKHLYRRDVHFVGIGFMF